MYNTFIYCSGKSGSSTLNSTFKSNGYNVYKLHSEEDYNNKHKNEMPIYKIIDMSRKKNNIAFIDSYRLPIERKISSFFHNIRHHIPDYQTKSIQDLIDIFNNKYLYELENYHSINEPMDHYNIPRFKTFNFKKRYNIKYHQNMIFIKLHFNDISNWDKILSEITNKPIIIKSTNLSKDSFYKDIYNSFKEIYKIPIDYLSVIENDAEFKIYNTPQEQIDYLSKWKLKSFNKIT